MSEYRKLEKLADDFDEALWKWARDVAEKFTPIFEELEAKGFFENDNWSLYEEDLNDPYWANEEWEVFI